MEPTDRDLKLPEFVAVWELIKKWDIGKRGLYSGATGTDVMEILNALRPFLIRLPKKSTRRSRWRFIGIGNVIAGIFLVV